MSKTFLILGCGNMASALVKGMYQVDCSLKFITYTPSLKRAKLLAQEVDGEILGDLTVLPSADFIMIACKPQQFLALANEIKGKIGDKTIILSILAGTSIATIEQALDFKKIIRIMPNTPALVGHGVNAFYFTSTVNKSSQSYILNIFEAFSEVFHFENEELINTITPFSGSGPAYYFELTRIMINYLIEKGLSSEDANRMIRATAFGAGKLMKDSSETVESLRNNVTSKGGVTYEALQVFKEYNLEKITIEAIEAGLKRTNELS